MADPVKVGDRSGGAGASAGHKRVDADTTEAILKAIRDELDDFRAKQAAFMTKLDTDFVAQNAAVASSQLDVNYASTAALGDVQFQK